MLQKLILVALFGMVVCSGGGHHGGHGKGGHGVYAHASPKYSFAYGVHDSNYGAKFGHSESRDGYNTQGEYFVHLPDGRVQKVTYYADQNGYHPTVSYSGKAHFPSHGKGVGYH